MELVLLIPVEPLHNSIFGNAECADCIPAAKDLYPCGRGKELLLGDKIRFVFVPLLRFERAIFLIYGWEGADGISVHDTEAVDHPRKRTRCIRPAGEAEQKELSSWLIIGNDKVVRLDYVLSKTKATSTYKSVHDELISPWSGMLIAPCTASCTPLMARLYHFSFPEEPVPTPA
jgi:hypothetical protein